MKKCYLLCLALSLSLCSLTAQVTDVVTGLSVPYGLVFNGSDLIVSQFTGNVISQFDVNEVPPMLETVLSGVTNPTAMILNGNELIYARGNGNAGIFKIDLTEENPSPVSILENAGLSLITSLLLDGDILYVADRDNGRVYSLDLSQMSPTLTEIASGFNVPTGVVKQGNLLYVLSRSGGSLSTVDLSVSPAVVSTYLTGLNLPVGLVRDGSFLYIAEDDKVSRVDLNQPTPTAQLVTDDVSAPGLVAFNGLDLYITERSAGKIVKLAISTPTFPTQPTICLGSDPVELGGASPAGGVYSGPNVTDNGDGNTFAFDAATAGAGMHTITYTIDGAMVTGTVTVAESPTVTFSTGDLSVQEDAGVQTDLGGGLPTGGVYSGNGVTDDGNGMTYSFDPAAAGVGENVITYTYMDANGCSGTQGAVVTVEDCPDITFTPTLTGVCADAGVQAGLGGGLPAGGVYSGPGITDDGNGMTFSFDPTTAGVGAQTVTYTVTESNIDQEQTDGNSQGDIGAAPLAQSFIPTATQICGAGFFVLSGSGDLTIELWDALPNEPAANMLASSTATAVNANNSFVDVSWPVVPVEPGNTYYLVLNGTDGSTTIRFSTANPYANGIAYGSNISPYQSVPGGDLAFRTFTCSTGTCSGEATAQIEVFALPEVTFVPSISTVALNAGTQSISGGMPVGGVYSGNGVTDDGNGMTFSFDPAAAGVGENVITYTYMDANGCSGTQGAVITVECPAITFTPTLTGVCADAGVQTGLGGGLPAGGVYSGPGITDDGNGMTFSFDPTTAGVGAQTVTYTVTESNIDQEETSNVTGVGLISAAPLAQSFIPAAAQMCGAGLYILSGSGEITIALWDALPNEPGASMLASGTAAVTASSYVDVSWSEVAVMPGNTYFLVINGTDGNTLISGDFSNPYANGIFYGSFNFPYEAAPGTDVAFRTFTCSTGDCSGEATAQIEVFALPEVTFVPSISTVALNAGTQSISGGMPVGGVYSGNGVTDDGNGMTFSFDPAAAGEGENVITYAFTDANGCSGMQGAVITVEEAMVLPGDECPDANDINALFGGDDNVPVVSAVQDNTGYDAGNDPGVGYECFAGDPILNNTIWYAFTGDGNKYSIRSVACGDDNPMTNTDTQFALYSGDCENPTPVACNDDEDFGNQVYNSYLELVTEPGVNYILMVDGYGSPNDYFAIGEFCLEVTRLAPDNVTNINETTLKVYPNPTTGEIQLPQLEMDRLEVYDATGRLVLNLEQPVPSINIANQPAGLYLLKMYAGKDVYSAKVVKE